jgi:hypothetical protein
MYTCTIHSIAIESPVHQMNSLYLFTTVPPRPRFSVFISQLSGMQGSSDFPAPRRAPAPLGPGAGVVGALFATFALGFTEGCLEIARRPIPLRFALRFAAANLLPSAVWSSVSACDVATASGVPSSALIRDGSSSSMSVGKRLVLVKSVRALRMAAGSYGLAWSLWRWHEAADGGINDSDGGTACGESVVRLAPVNSPLSRASRRKHGEHIVTVPLTTESWKNRGTSKAVDAVDWENVGVQVEDEDNGHVDRVKVLEVELGDAQAATFARKLKANAVRTGATLCSVAVLPLFGEPLPMKIVETFTVCFNPMSAVLTFVASVCRDRGVAHVCLVQEHDRETADADTEGPNGGNSHFSTSQLATGLLYLHGITTTVVTTPPRGLVDEQEKDEPTVGDSGVVFFISDSLVAGQLAAANMAEQGTCRREGGIVKWV